MKLKKVFSLSDSFFYITLIFVSVAFILSSLYCFISYLTYFSPHSRSFNSKNLEIISYSNKLRIDLQGVHSLLRTHCETNSNSPLLECTDTVVVSKVSNETKLKIGDLALYQINNSKEFSTPIWIFFGSFLRIAHLEKEILPPAKNLRIIHAIVDYDFIRDCYVLKGINNLLQDPYCVKKNDIHLKVEAIIYTDQTYAMS